MPAPAEADLPRLHREVEALRLRNQLDPKRFYRKDEGEGKGIKGLPKYFAVCLTPVILLFPFKSGFRSARLSPQNLPLEAQVMIIFRGANANGHWWMSSLMMQKQSDTQRRNSTNYSLLGAPKAKTPSGLNKLYENLNGKK